MFTLLKNLILSVYGLKYLLGYLAAVYHPPEPQYNADNLIDFLANTCNDILVSDPNSKLIICGDLNQLRYKDLLLQNSLFQMVRSPTRQD